MTLISNPTTLADSGLQDGLAQQLRRPAPDQLSNVDTQAVQLQVELSSVTVTLVIVSQAGVAAARVQVPGATVPVPGLRAAGPQSNVVL